MHRLRRVQSPRSGIYETFFTKDSIALGLAQGRALIELQEIEPILNTWVEELISEGKAFASEWTKHPQTGEIYRTITNRPLLPSEKVKKDEHN